MKAILTLFILGAAFATADTLPSEKRKNGPLLRQALSPVQVALQESSAVFYNNETSRAFLYGTVVSSDGLILTKATELDEVEDFYVRVGARKYRTPKVLNRNDIWDVALVKIEAEELVPVRVEESRTFPHGTWVVSNGATERRFRRARAGIISANKREIPESEGVAMGVTLKEEDGHLVVAGITEKSGAEAAGLKENDRIVRFAGAEVTKREQIVKALKGREAGDMIAVVLERGEGTLEVEIELMSREKLFGRQMTRNDQLSGGDDQQSERRTGFPVVIQHETMLTRHEVGGPVFTLDHEFVGMNIAAVNRVEAFAIPAEEIPGIVENLLKKE